MSAHSTRVQLQPPVYRVMKRMQPARVQLQPPVYEQGSTIQPPPLVAHQFPRVDTADAYEIAIKHEVENEIQRHLTPNEQALVRLTIRLVSRDLY
jgi:hypothetical protein